MNNSNKNSDLGNQPIAWTPSPDVVERAQLTRFMKQVGVSTWDELYKFSIDDVEKFTEEVLKFLDIKFDPPYEKLLDISNGIELPTWFGGSADTLVRMDAAPASRKSTGKTSFAGGTGDADKSVRAPDAAPASRKSTGRTSFAGGTGDADKSVRAPAGLNITEMCLDRWQTDEMKDQPSIIWEGESGKIEKFTYEQLFEYVESCAAGLTRFGFQKGDAIGIHLPMIAETIVALLAINRIGAIAVPVFSGYGIDAISSRLNVVKAKGLFTSAGFTRRGKFFDALQIAEKAVENCPAIKKIFVCSCNEDGFLSNRTSDERYSEFIDLFSENNPSLSPETAAEDPLIILYTSGTTGKPKGIAHTHASFPIKAAQDMAFGTDVGRGTRICWYTDIGWMMGPWLIYGALINGATICIYDGAPDYPTPDRMWEFCAKHKVEVLGISPTLIRSLASGSADTPVRMDAAPASKERVATKSHSTDESVESGGSADTPVRIAGSSGESLSRRRSDADADKSVRAPSTLASKEYAGTTFLGGGTGDADKSVRAPFERRGWYRHNLPHYDGSVTQFITFRLGDSLPKGFLEKLKYRLEHDKHTDFSEEYRERIEDYLDSGAGECILSDPAVAELLEETILYEHGSSCDVKAWVIMPNHAHLLMRPYPGHALAAIMKRIKGISARKINVHLDRSGKVWQADYFDRYIRDEDDFLRKLAYIENNPVKAGFVSDTASWRFSSASRSADTLVRIGVASTARQTLAGGTGDADRSVRAPAELAPHERHDLSSLRIFASTGEPWNPAPWWWLFEKVGNSKLPIINYSGGTEISGGILMGNPLLPIKPCSFPAPCPGMDVDILNEDGEPVKPGEVGELVIKQPWIGMARGFWQENDRYLDAYWRRFKDIWVHGDFAMRDADDHWFILGRSDDTLKVAGKRVGPAEVESLLVAHPHVIEAAVIGVPDEIKGTAMVAFVVRSTARSADTPVRMDAAPASKEFASKTHLAGGTGDADKSVRAPAAAPASKEFAGKTFLAGGTGDADKSVRAPAAAPASKEFASKTHLAGGTGDADKSVRAPSSASASRKSTGKTLLAGGTGDADKSVRAPLEDELKALVARDMGKPLAPSKIHFVSALPKTRNAKVMRRVIRSAYLGEDPGDLSALENPQIVEEIGRARS